MKFLSEIEVAKASTGLAKGAGSTVKQIEMEILNAVASKGAGAKTTVVAGNGAAAKGVSVIGKGASVAGKGVIASGKGATAMSTGVVTAGKSAYAYTTTKILTIFAGAGISVGLLGPLMLVLLAGLGILWYTRRLKSEKGDEGLVN
ncbi:MAG: hypothetical protein HQM13_21905 [SAR324 cluster bacterium]|nr:hypothetical protein [SAR324 cluster bacterium]